MYATNPEFRQHCATQLVQKEMFFAYSEEQHLDEAEEFKANMEKYRKELLSRMAVNKILEGITVTEEELQAYYDEHKDQFSNGPLASAKHILVDSTDECQRIRGEIEAGALSFEEAAEKYSTCPSGKKGGDLGEFGKGQMVPEFDAVVFSANIGELVGPIQTQFGSHLVRVERRKEAEVAPFERVKPQIEYNLLEEKERNVYDAKVEELEKIYCEG
jgi:peptidyl-prolyl cis-trans isomerase C